MNLVTFSFGAINSRKTSISSLSINFINYTFADVCAETTFLTNGLKHVHITFIVG